MGSIPCETEEVTVEVRDAAPTHYLLKIEAFSLLSESGIDKYESNEFEASGYKWKMIIYPDGNRNEKGSEHISVYLAITGTGSLPAGWEVNVTVTFFLFNQLCNNYFTVRGKLQRFHSVKSEWGLPKFLPHKIFKEAGYLVYDKCSFGAEILVGQDSRSVRVGRKKNRIKHIQRQAVGECLSMVKSNNSFKCEWKMRNFSNLGVDWMSEEFTAADHKWIVKLQPKGTVHHDEYQVSIYLCSVDSKNFDPNQKVKANCSICINDQIKGGGYKRSYCTWFATTKNVRGYPQFIPLTQLLDNKRGYIVNDCIAVEIEFTHRVKSLVILD